MRKLYELKESKQTPTAEDQEVLAKYVGWGGLKQILLNPDRKAEWSVKSDQQYREFVRESIQAINDLDRVDKLKFLDIPRNLFTCFPNKAATVYPFNPNHWPNHTAVSRGRFRCGRWSQSIRPRVSSPASPAHSPAFPEKYKLM